MQRSTIRTWFLIHKWTSIVCTGFLLMLCVTGLPLIFHDEIDALTEDMRNYGMPGVGSSGEAPGLKPLDEMLAKALAARPGEVPVFMAFDNEQPSMTITTAPRADSPAEDMTIQILDRSTGAGTATVDESGVMHFLLQLHTDMFLGLPGMLFLGLMGLLFVIAIVSGVVLYAPFMKKLDFGTLRTSRSRRVKWLDYHNLLGIVALAWMTVVGATGVINALATPIFEYWQRTELAEMTKTYAGKGAVPPENYGSIDKAMAAARKEIPGNNPQFIAFPGGAFSSKHHYAVFFQGDTPLTERLLTAALIDAETGDFTDARPMPWYAKALALSQPLHFGDYGALPLKLLWAILTVFTMIILGSGLYLWLGKRRFGTDALVREVESGGTLQPAE
ncbi:peptidase [Sphingopyxis sp. H038]|uniref:PepSY-associated TM helix domain-containing protein n=1 Tax=unclassified Sphingopyxis TaxID=2614943 RepID=UPI00073098C8|nr:MULTISPECIES: PepSY domain-containing protein [unclassified Sphingopyxis]KTE02615.1 peptidase [Sphingopyxis sp. H012]KTE11176.1 peptidase [Sphingopyxis sp. H053]KTE12226.1 peptidase [Sphingopyxis sp. H093]KTE30658.1 peptidase [Sphingopyxis sp. H080]KTE35664.1 peptidase [Sphingopyxis sp. H038]